TRGDGLPVESDGEARFAVGLGFRQAIERLPSGLDLLIVKSELIAGKARPLARGADNHLAFQFELGGGRAVKVAAVNRHFRRRSLGNSLGSGRKIEFESIGDIVFD